MKQRFLLWLYDALPEFALALAFAFLCAAVVGLIALVREAGC